ncbi:MAG: hypothetical protein Ct9H300mP7_0020 [Verrucomicrobiota bacterium]|nr:MAG: hypothetical protein Ct9H300mP7_0020 [Verrucomicrobiota bacterium]
MGWDTPEGSTELTLKFQGKGFGRSITVAPGNGKPVVVLRDTDPVTVYLLGNAT